MTSQGVGDPFVLGEVIMGYQACELEGSIYIGENQDADYDCGEKLMYISDGDEAAFRYIRSEKEYGEIRIQAAGSGQIEVLFNGQTAGVVQVQDGVQQSNKIRMEPGEYELRLRFCQSKQLEIYQIVLN